MYSIFQTHMQSVYVTFTQFHRCVSLCFQNICYAHRFCLRMHSIQLMWAKWRMSFHVARKKKEPVLFAIWHGVCGLRDYLVQCAWSPSFGLLFFLFHLAPVVDNCTYRSANTVWCVVVLCTTYMWVILSSQISSLPPFCAVAVDFPPFPHVHLAWGKRLYDHCSMSLSKHS